jgi:hypothetical protein
MLKFTTALAAISLMGLVNAMAQGGTLTLTGGFQKVCNSGAGDQPGIADALSCRTAALANGKPTYTVGCLKGGLLMMTPARPTTDNGLAPTSSEISKEPRNAGRWAEEYGSCALAWGEK